MFSLGIGWGPEFWSAEGSTLGRVLEQAEPASVKLDFQEELHSVHEHHGALAGLLALGKRPFWACCGCRLGLRLTADSIRRALRSGLPPIHAFLMKKWYFDELYDAILVIPVVKLAFFIGRFDKRTSRPEDAEAADRRIDPSSVDGLLSAIGLLMGVLGQRLRAMQTGLIRRYVLVLVLTTVVMFAILSFLAT